MIPRAVLSLGRPRRTTVFLFLALTAAWILLFFFHPDSIRWLVVLFAALVNTHAIAIWIFFLWQFSRPSSRVRTAVGLFRPFALFVITVVATSIVHATVLRLDETAYAGQPLGLSRAGEWGVGAFLAIETMSTLGSGTIIAKTAAALASVAYNALAAILYGLFAVAMALSMISKDSRKI